MKDKTNDQAFVRSKAYKPASIKERPKLERRYVESKCEFLRAIVMSKQFYQPGREVTRP